MGGARSRRVFKQQQQPGDYDYLDEQEQEGLIEALAERNETANARFKRFFAILVVAFAPLYVSSYSNAGLLASLLAVSSLFATAYTIYQLPYLSVAFTPTERYLPAMNVLLACVTGLVGYMRSDRNSLIWFVPLGACLVGEGARWSMDTVDIDSLSKLKYKYKGA